jgi:hypothetical protein
LLQTRQPAEARRRLEAILDSGPDPEASWLLSRCFVQDGDWDRAATALKQGRVYRAEHPLEPEPAPFVGAARCAACHRATYQAVLASRHASTFASAQELEDLPLPDHPLPDPGNPRVTHSFEQAADGLRVETRAGGRVLGALVEYAFGSRDHFMTFVGRDQRRCARMLRISRFDSPKGPGWDLSTGLDPHPVDEEEYLGKVMADRDGERRCLTCHTTNFRAAVDRVGPEAADHAIGCEGCHGPGAHHVAAVQAKFPDLAIANPAQAQGYAINQLCGRCHGLHHKDAFVAPPADSIWFRFQASSLPQSRCFTESGGALSCATCHDPHRNVETSAARNEAKCLSCHEPTAPATPARRTDQGEGRRPPGEARTSCPINPARGCIECHMPRAWNQGTRSFKTDHYIRVPKDL